VRRVQDKAKHKRRRVRRYNNRLFLCFNFVSDLTHSFIPDQYIYIMKYIIAYCTVPGSYCTSVRLYG
jgi:hypothetical protein